MNNSNSPKPDKVSTLWFTLFLIFLVVFNVLFFLISGTEHSAAVWISYGFIHFAYFMLALTPRFVRKGKSSAIFGFSLIFISAVYFVSAFVVGIIFIIIAPQSYTAALSVQLSMAGLYGILLISHAIANERTAEAEEKREYNVEYIKSATAQLKSILERVKDRETKRKVEKAYDAVNSSPVKSHPNIEQMERRILTLIDELDDAIAAGDKQVIFFTVDLLLTAVTERSSKLKAYLR